VNRNIKLLYGFSFFDPFMIVIPRGSRQSLENWSHHLVCPVYAVSVASLACTLPLGLRAVGRRNRRGDPSSTWTLNGRLMFAVGTERPRATTERIAPPEMAVQFPVSQESPRNSFRRPATPPTASPCRPATMACRTARTGVDAPSTGLLRWADESLSSLPLPAGLERSHARPGAHKVAVQIQIQPRMSDSDCVRQIRAAALA
jgi:hypothetical protein